MDEQRPSEDGGIDPVAGQQHPRSAAGVPRWVKMFGIVAAVLALLVAALLIAGHGPGRHLNGLGAVAITGGAFAGRLR